MWRKLAGRKAECCAAHPKIDSRSADYCAVKPYIIFNPTAGSVADAPRILAELKRLRPRAVSITNKSGDAEKWSRQPARAGGPYIVAAGRDGTLNEGVNGSLGTRKQQRIGI